MTQEIMIDAKGKKLGRLASGVALALRGKTNPGFLPHDTDLPRVTVTNVDGLDLSEKKLKSKFFATYSGYPSGRKQTNIWEVAQKNKFAVLRHAVLGMLPHNRLRKIMIKNLVLKHGEDK